MAIPQGGTYDLTIYQGATFRQVFQLREADQTTPIDLTGYTARAQVRTKAGGVLLLTFTCSHDNAAGNITVSATPAVTATLTSGGVWALEIANGTDTYVLIEGVVERKPEITTP